MHTVSKLLDIPTTDPDDARRRKLLNILLLGIGVLTLFALLVIIYADIIALYDQRRITVLYGASLATLIALVFIFAINRYGPGWLASLLFLLLFTTISSLADEPAEVAVGRSVMIFTVPVVMAGVILPSYASFILAGLSSLVISGIALSMDLPPNPFAMVCYFSVATASWLSARSLEQALRDLRALNLELDQRVEERTLEVAEAFSRNQAILEGIADGVIVFDRDGKAMVANLAIVELLERPLDKITGFDIETLMGQDVDAADREMVVNLLTDRGSSHPSVKFEWGDKTLSVSFAPVRDVSEEVTGTVAVFRDFTREAEVDRMKSTFVSMASHELRTPLNAILGYAEMLREAVYGPLLDKQNGVIERIMANTGQMVSLVNNLLDQAEIEAGRLALNVTSFAPADLIDGVQSVMGVLAQAKGLELTSYIADDVPATLSGDRQRLHQILVNLVGNAIKFTEQGAVHVRAYRPNASHWALEVSDTGRGIPSEAQARIFDPFRQADDLVTREHAGFGLGLSIVRQLITMMGGEITLASEVGRGSTFTVLLPLASTQEGLS
jgi:signal transduction histidine kinase